jgi:hypothetical protein
MPLENPDARSKEILRLSDNQIRNMMQAIIYAENRGNEIEYFSIINHSTDNEHGLHHDISVIGFARGKKAKNRKIVLIENLGEQNESSSETK